MCGRVEFVSYSGSYPNLCSGELVLKIDGEVVRWKRCMCSGGGLTEDYDVYEGAWSVDVPDEYKHLKSEIESVVNANVEYGCCGGCV